MMQYNSKLLSVLFLMCVTGSAFAANLGLVVGVSSYPNLGEHFQLRGPKYDAEMVSEYLRSNPYRQFDNLTVLADGVDGAELPTRKAILGALGELQQMAKNGDFVYLHFSGHGSRAPAKNPGNETDGLDELFLPADIGQWNDAVGEVENALLDDELGEKISAIRSKGAFVWAVFDSCHSGTVTRGAPTGDEVRYRRVDDSALGIPDDALINAGGMTMRGITPERLINSPASPDETVMRGIEPERLIHAPTMPIESQTRGLPTAGSEKKSGGFVAFYAAQSTETTPEMRLPAGEPGRVSHGLFSFTLLNVIAEHPGITYRQAAQEILQRYSSSYMVSPTPLFEGDLDARVFDVEPTDVIPQWPLVISDGKIKIPAGLLHGLGTGQTLALMPGPAAQNDKQIASVEIESLTAFESVVRVVDGESNKASSGESIPKGAYARVIDNPVSFQIRVARPIVPADAGVKKADRVETILKRISAPDNSGLRIQWAGEHDAADIRLGWSDATDAIPEQLWLLPPTGEIITSGVHKTPSIIFDNKSDAEVAAVLTDSLVRISRVTNLLKLGGAMGPASIDAKLRLDRQGQGNLTDSDPVQVPHVYPGDIVHLSAHNPGMKPVDINVLFIGSDYSITHTYKERIHPNDTLDAAIAGITSESFGTERVLVIVNEAEKQTEVQDFSFLEQRALPKTRAFRNSMENMLVHAGFGETTRGGVPPKASSQGQKSAIIQFPLLTQPAR